MISNIQKYAREKGLSIQDSLQVFMQVVLLKNMVSMSARLIGGTALVMGHNNPRFSEDIDLTGVKEALKLRPQIEKASIEIEALLGSNLAIKAPRPGLATWRLSCRAESVNATVHVDSQTYPALSRHAIFVEYPGIAPFVFGSVEKDEILADKLIALAFRNNLSGRDIFDLWYHWFKDANPQMHADSIMKYVPQKLKKRDLSEADFVKRIGSRFSTGITRRIEDEWNRYLPVSLKGEELYQQIFSTVQNHLAKINL